MKEDFSPHYKLIMLGAYGRTLPLLFVIARNEAIAKTKIASFLAMT